MRYALVVSPPFLVAIGALVLSLAGVVDLDPRVLGRALRFVAETLADILIERGLAR